jgi:L-ascorbate metabolism protein UlaG (beta-lactamase superfamily)
MRVTNLGHATLMVEMGGVRVLTDPNFDARLGGVLPRVRTTGLTWGALPAPDAVLLSHAHADHLSFASLRALTARLRVPIYAPAGVARWLVARGHPDARAIRPGESASISGAAGTVTVTAGAAAHEGSRYGFDRWGGRGDANSYLIDSGAESAFFAGDTGLRGDSHALVAQAISARGRQLDAALLPIGRAPWWKPGFRRNHLSPADALELFDWLGARVLIPYHWGTFHHLTSGPFDAIQELEARLADYPRRADVRMVPPGAQLVLGVRS